MIPLVASWFTEGVNPGDHTGEVLASGDLDGDGVGDVVAGVPFHDWAQPMEGSVRVWYGARGGPGALEDWDHQGGEASSYLGDALAIGDFDADGIDDLAVAQPWFGADDAGRVLVFVGTPTGLRTTPDVVLPGAAGDQLGSALATGDVDGDGFADLAATAPGFDGVGPREGRLVIFRGGSAGLASPATWTVPSGVASAGFGSDLAVGDLDCDGRADLASDWTTWSGGQADEGRIGVWLGGPAGPAAAPSWTWEPDQTRVYGASALLAADWTGDGCDDLAAGLSSWDGAQTDQGRAVVFYGRVGGPPAAPSWSVQGNQAQADAGMALAAGDVDADGRADLIVSAPTFDPAGRMGSNEGAIAVFHGQAGALAAAIGRFAVSGVSDVGFGYGLAAGDIDGDGKDEVLVGATGYDLTSPTSGEGAIAAFGVR